MQFTIRPRSDADFAALEQLLDRMQPESNYPQIWPFPGGAASFLARPGELGAWVAELADGRIVGHVALTRAKDDDMGRSWSGALGATIDELRCVCALFTDSSFAGSGIGSALLAHVTNAAERDGWPVLEVVTSTERPVQLYLRRGWQIVSTEAPWWDPTQQVHLMVWPRGAAG